MHRIVLAVVVVAAVCATGARATSVEGTVREKGTRRPVPGALVVISHSESVTMTDEQGAFFIDVAAAHATTVTLEVDTSGYAPLVQVIDLRAERETTSIDLFLLPTQAGETTLRERRSKDNVARGAHRIDGTEVNEMPGTYGDPAKAIENFPGMGRVLLSQGSLFVRGALPNESAVFVDDYEIPDLYHYTGSTSVINIPFVESVELVPGAFSARYGRSTGGIVTLKTKKLPTDDVHGFAKLDTIDGGVYVGVPVTPTVAVGASARRSWLDIARDVQKSVRGTGDDVLLTPTYWDYQLKLDWDTAPGHELVVFAFGSGDRELYEADGAGALDAYTRTNDSDFHRLSLRYQHSIGGGFIHTFTPVLGYARQTLLEQGGLRYADRQTYDVQLRDELTWRSGNSRIIVGIDTTARRDAFEYGGFLADDGTLELASPDLSVIAGRARVREQTWRATGAAYIEGTLEPLAHVTLTPGLRVEGYVLDGATHGFVEPRAAAAWDVTPGAWGTTLKVGAGAFSRPPDADEIAAATRAGTQLPPQQALQVQSAFEQDIAQTVTLSATVFTVWRDGLTQKSPTFPVPLRPGAPAVTGDGSGQSSGIEMLARAGVPNRYYAWVSYALVRNERRDGNSVLGVRYPYVSAFDTTHLLGVVGQVHLWWGFRVGARYRIASGMPQDAVAGALFDADTGRYELVRGARANSRLPLFQAVDVRVDWSTAFDWFTLDLYADLSNLNTAVFGRPVEGAYLNFDYSQSAPRYGLPIIPAVGAKASF